MRESQEQMETDLSASDTTVSLLEDIEVLGGEAESVVKERAGLLKLCGGGADDMDDRDTLGHRTRNAVNGTELPNTVGGQQGS